MDIELENVYVKNLKENLFLSLASFDIKKFKETISILKLNTDNVKVSAIFKLLTNNYNDLRIPMSLLSLVRLSILNYKNNLFEQDIFNNSINYAKSYNKKIESKGTKEFKIGFLIEVEKELVKNGFTSDFIFNEDTSSEVLKKMVGGEKITINSLVDAEVFLKIINLDFFILKEIREKLCLNNNLFYAFVDKYKDKFKNNTDFNNFINLELKKYGNVLEDFIFKGSTDEKITYCFDLKLTEEKEFENLLPLHKLYKKINPFKAFNSNFVLNYFFFSLIQKEEGDDRAINMFFSGSSNNIQMFSQHKFYELLKDKKSFLNNEQIKSILQTKNITAEMFDVLISIAPEEDSLQYIDDKNKRSVLMRFSNKIEEWININSKNLEYLKSPQNVELIFRNYKTMDAAKKILENNLIEKNDEFFVMVNGLLDAYKKNNMAKNEEHYSFLKETYIKYSISDANINKKIKI